MHSRILATIAAVAALLTTVLFLSLVMQGTGGEDIPESRARRDGVYWNLSPRTLLSRLSLFPPHEPPMRRLMGVIVENHHGARPHHAGLERALLVEEMLVEGGISRFALLYDLDDMPPDIGPLRSLRSYFIEGMRAYAPVLLFAGGSPDALESIRQTEEMTGINALRQSDETHFYRKPGVPAPHDLFLKTEHIDALLPETDAIPWPPFETGKMKETGVHAEKVSITFYSRLHDVAFTYSPEERHYLRINGGMESAATPANIVVVEAPVQSVGEYGRLTIPLSGTGNALLFRDGFAYDILWEKSESSSPFRFFFAHGMTAPLAQGPTWITVLPDIARVTWEASEPSL